jgi:L-rhamnonate dehydratase
MNRRNFLMTVPALSTLPSLSLQAQTSQKSGLKIVDMQFWQLKGKRQPSEGFFGWIQANPLQVYPEYTPDPSKWKQEPQAGPLPYDALYLKLLTDAGLEGLYGPIDREAAVVVDRQLKGFLIGQDPLAGEVLWDKMYRYNRHSRAGHFMMAISAVDNALWDLRGKFFNAPVYRLLGGPSREAVEVYGSCLGYSINPADIRDRSLRIKSQGFRSQKWFFPFGPASGSEGLKHNVEMVRTLRESLGPDEDIMFDAFMGWTLDYAISWAQQVESYRPRWIEEVFQPNQIESFVQLRQKTTIPVAAGEHLYTRWDVYEYLKEHAITVVQSDPEWCGGISELVKICAVAELFGAQVIPHGHSLHAALHVIASQSPAVCPYGEYLFNKMDNYYLFEKFQLKPEDGKIRLSDKPGFGIEFDESRIEEKKLLTDL